MKNYNLTKKWEELTKEMLEKGYFLIDEFSKDYALLVSGGGDIYALENCEIIESGDVFSRIMHYTMKTPQQLTLQDFESVFERVNSDDPMITEIMTLLYHTNKPKRSLDPYIYNELWIAGSAVLKKEGIPFESERDVAIREDIERLVCKMRVIDGDGDDETLEEKVGYYQNIAKKLGLTDFKNEQTLYDTIEKFVKFLKENYHYVDGNIENFSKDNINEKVLVEQLYDDCIRHFCYPLYTGIDDKVFAILLQGNKK